MVQHRVAKKQKAHPQEDFGRMRLPRRGELEQFAMVTQIMGSNNLRAMCEDGTERVCRIPGKMRKRVWIRNNDVIIVRLWDFQPAKADIVWRYLGGQTEWLRRKGYLQKLPL